MPTICIIHRVLGDEIKKTGYGFHWKCLFTPKEIAVCPSGEIPLVFGNSATISNCEDLGGIGLDEIIVITPVGSVINK